MSKQKVKIQYGVLAGKQVGHRLEKALKAAGYEIVKDAQDADIIIAHSAGCFWLPAAPAKQKLLLIDPPYWPGKTIGERGRARVKRNFQLWSFKYPLRQWISRNLWGIYYAIRDFNRTRRIVKLAQTYNLEKAIENHTVTLIRNEHDEWLTPDLADLQSRHPNLTIKLLPGDHEDCTYNPAPYINLLQSEI